MSISLYDAHAHLPGTDFKDHDLLPQTDLRVLNLQFSVVNSVSPADWPVVLKLSEEASQIIPAIGLHPKEVETAPDDWKKTFLELLSKGARGIGEIGLDRRSKNDDIEKQMDAFHWQLKRAHIHNLPVSVHCIKAIGLLMDTLRTHDLPTRGVHLHAYNGPIELIPELSELGAYFSFNNKQMDYKSSKIARCIRAVPIQRLLIETDMPFRNDFSNLQKSYAAIAEMRQIPFDALAKQIADNFKTYFLAQ